MGMAAAGWKPTVGNRQGKKWGVAILAAGNCAGTTTSAEMLLWACLRRAGSPAPRRNSTRLQFECTIGL